ncbi:unnamed protein product [Lactuca saligna]|uniref:Uncharacterized protein n=1 Tax=Lactuca saligna TaxID=75948 RepID=A0AA35Z1M5_LACSI|nr:unnamed protein product [Lactuca saligna]
MRVLQNLMWVSSQVQEWVISLPSSSSPSVFSLNITFRLIVRRRRKGAAFAKPENACQHLGFFSLAAIARFYEAFSVKHDLVRNQGRSYFSKVDHLFQFPIGVVLMKKMCCLEPKLFWFLFWDLIPSVGADGDGGVASNPSFKCNYANCSSIALIL